MYLSVLAIAAWVALCLNVKSSTKGIRILKDKSKHAQCVHIQTKTYTCNCTHINVPSTNCSALISAHITYHEQIQFQDEGIVIYLVKQILKAGLIFIIFTDHHDLPFSFLVLALLRANEKTKESLVLEFLHRQDFHIPGDILVNREAET